MYISYSKTKVIPRLFRYTADLSAYCLNKKTNITVDNTVREYSVGTVLYNCGSSRVYVYGNYTVIGQDTSPSEYIEANLDELSVDLETLYRWFISTAMVVPGKEIRVRQRGIQSGRCYYTAIVNLYKRRVY